MLPVDLPTSVEGTIGFIRYSVIVNLDRPMWPDQEFEESFTVLKAVNLNDNMALRVMQLYSRNEIVFFFTLFYLAVPPRTRNAQNIFCFLLVVLL